MTSYGNRDQVRQGQEVTAPDGRVFVQGDRATYRRVELDPATRPEGYRQDYGPRPAASPRATQGERAAGKVSPETAPEDYHGFRIESREPSECGRFWDVTYTDLTGASHQTRRLRSAREGNG